MIRITHIDDFENAGARLSKDGERVIPVYVGCSMSTHAKKLPLWVDQTRSPHRLANDRNLREPDLGEDKLLVWFGSNQLGGLGMEGATIDC